MATHSDGEISLWADRLTDVHRWTDGQTDSQTDLCTDGQVAAGSWQVSRWMNNKQTEPLTKFGSKVQNIF